MEKTSVYDSGRCKSGMPRSSCVGAFKLPISGAFGAGTDPPTACLPPARAFGTALTGMATGADGLGALLLPLLAVVLMTLPAAQIAKAENSKVPCTDVTGGSSARRRVLPQGAGQ